MSKASEMENVAAIAMHVARHRNFSKAYSAAADTMGGFPGFYEASIDLAQALEEYEQKHDISWGNDADWILTTEAIGDHLVKFMVKHGRLPLDSEVANMIKDSIS